MGKPEDQKTPKDDRLRQWYIDMLVECQKRGIVGKLTNMYDLYFSNKSNDATVVPYMEGDYFPAEVENIIKDIDEGKVGKKNGGKEGKKKKGDKKQKRKSGRGGTRSSGIDEDALKASGIQFPDQRSLEEGGRDYVMVKLGETIQPMKESFIVAHLAWKGAKKEDIMVPKAILEYRREHNVTIVDGPEIELEEEKTPDNAEQKPTNKTEGTAASNGTENSSEDKDDSKPEDTDMKHPEDKKESDSKSAENPKSTDNENGQDQSKPENENEKVAEKSESVGDKVEVKTEDVEMKESEGSKDVTMTDASEKPQPEQADEAKKEDDKDDKSEKQDDSMDVEKNNETEDSKDDSNSNSKAIDESVKKESETTANVDDKLDENAATPSDETKTDKKDSVVEKNADETVATNVETAESKTDQNAEKKKEDPVASADVANESGAKPAANGTKPPAPSENGEAPKSSTLSMQERSGKFAAMAKKRGISGEEKKDTSTKESKDKTKKGKAEAAPVIYVLDSKGRRVKVIDDDAEEMDCEFLNNRQAFLNLCQGNHYQFDHLRRAKHSSMMVLWHLHNRDAPKFVQQCTTCSREILTGYRYHCPTCADFDQCLECIQNPNTPRHPHQLKPIPVSGQQTELTEAQRKERQRSIQLHMTLLQHAATCHSPKCPSANCQKMKGLLKHGAQCKIKATGGCNVCKRIWALLQIHARQCKASQCPVPNCMAIRERVRQLKKQQQAMDDRRRQEMNRVYRGAR